MFEPSWVICSTGLRASGRAYVTTGNRISACGMFLLALGVRPGGAGAASITSVPWRVRLVIARCQVDYVGRLTAHLPMAQRLLLIKADGSVSVH